MKSYFIFFILFFSALLAHGFVVHLHKSEKKGSEKEPVKEDRDPHTQYFQSQGGSYHFRYDTGNVEHQSSFRGEKRYPQGTVTGYYGYIDPDGILRVTEYIADHYGYRQRTILRYPVKKTESE